MRCVHARGAQCGFSRAVIQVLRTQGVGHIAHINVLADDDVRRYAKEYRYGRCSALQETGRAQRRRPRALTRGRWARTGETAAGGMAQLVAHVPAGLCQGRVCGRLRHRRRDVQERRAGKAAQGEGRTALGLGAGNPWRTARPRAGRPHRHGRYARSGTRGWREAQLCLLSCLRSCSWMYKGGGYWRQYVQRAGSPPAWSRRAAAGGDERADPVALQDTVGVR